MITTLPLPLRILACTCLILPACQGMFARFAPQAKIQIDPDNHWFIDEFSRVRFFHGVNSVLKMPPWYHSYLLDDKRLDDFKRFGLNIVRLGTMWTGVEPTEGVYNETYINILQNIVTRLADRGVYTMLDMHQDVMSSYYNSYDGVPPWLIESFPPPSNPYPYPLESIDSWEQGYLTQACSEGFQHFYNNTNNALDKWSAFWVKIAQRFGPMPSVLGYNYINEPWVGDYLSNNELLLPGVAGKRNLLPTYDAVYKEILEVDTDSLQFYEPAFYGQATNGPVLGSGFDRVPGGPENAAFSAFSYHTYCWYLEFIGPDATDEDREEAIYNCTNSLLPSMFQAALDNVEQTGGVSILTEFGLCKTRGTAVNIDCEVFLRLADQYMQSWIDWDYNDFVWYDYATGEPNWETILTYVRPYPQAVAGIPLEFSFNHTTLEFKFRFSPWSDAEAPTQLFVPSLRYTTGYVMSSSPPVFTWITEGDIVFVIYNGTEEELPAEVLITIRPQ